MRILISYPKKLENEVDFIHQEMTSGKWDYFHLRKPDWSDEEMMTLLNNLNDEVKQKTILHKNFKASCHSFDEVEALNKKMIDNSCHFALIEGTGSQLNYCFLSPIFNSISKIGYRAKFDKKELKEFLKKERKIKVIALGGVTPENYQELIDMGFDGGAFLGSVWIKYVIARKNSLC